MVIYCFVIFILDLVVENDNYLLYFMGRYDSGLVGDWLVVFLLVLFGFFFLVVVVGIIGLNIGVLVVFLCGCFLFGRLFFEIFLCVLFYSRGIRTFFLVG